MSITSENDKNILKLNLTKDEQSIFKIAIEEYDDLFHKILEIPQINFISILEKYIQISLIQKNIILPSGTTKKILDIIKNHYYEPEYEKIHHLINSISNISNCEIYSENDFYPHCNKCKELIHTCGKKMYILNNKTYLLCLNCKRIYHSNLIELHCNTCDINYYSAIEKNFSKEKLKLATWSKYHCNAVMNDVMKCHKCKSLLYLNLQNKNLYCKICNIEINQKSIKWNCIICNKEFSSEAKIYNPYEFQIIKITIKETIFNGIDARPEILPCCNIKKEEINKIKFIHKKECNGNLFEGDLNNKKIVVCCKCHMLNFYEFHKWFCPFCKERFTIKEYKKELDFQRRITKSERRIHLKNSFDEIVYKSNFDEFKGNITSRKKCDFDDDLNYKHSQSSSFNDIQKFLKKNLLFSSANNLNKKISSGNLELYMKDNFFNDLEENKKEISQFDEIDNDYDIKQKKKYIKIYSSGMSPLKKRKMKFNESLNSKKIEKKLSNISINLNLNVNINNNNKIPILYNRMNSNHNISSSNNILLNDNYICHTEKKFFSSDDYNILSQIGEGTYGKIYKVEDKNHINYAMKKILANSIEEVNAIQSEYEMLTSLSKYKLNLVRIYGIETKKLDKTTFVIYILMDIAIRDWEKEIINRSQKRKFYQENELMIILKELVYTFAELQRHKISHRDIKPQNILLFPDNSFKISDFGEAKELMNNKRETIKQTIRGTELYMSPILFHALQKKNHSKYTEHNTFKSDVFSLGLCLLFASTLSFNCLYEIREIYDMILMKKIISKYLQRYSKKFCNILFLMLEIDERFRDDFIELEKRIEFI